MKVEKYAKKEIAEITRRRTCNLTAERLEFTKGLGAPLEFTFRFVARAK